MKSKSQMKRENIQKGRPMNRGVYNIYNNCMGSGSTGVACINLNRKFIGIELDRKFFDISKKRIKVVQC